MTTREDILKYAGDHVAQSIRFGLNFSEPIYVLYLFEHANKEMVVTQPDGTEKHLGFADIGCTKIEGFFYNLDMAIETLVSNWCDIWEGCYNAGFILCRFPGTTDHARIGQRMYFVFDRETKKYVQQEEPELFAHSAI